MRRLLKVIAVLTFSSVLFLGSCTATMVVISLSTNSGKTAEREKQQREKDRIAVGPLIPANFPLAVISPRSDGRVDVRIVPFGQLKTVTSASESYSFLVPAEREVLIDQHLIGPPENNEVVASVRVERRNPLRQEIVAEGSEPDAINIGWYEATEKTFTPRYHKFIPFSPAYSTGQTLESFGGAFLPSFLLNLVGWSAVAALVWRRLRRKDTEAKRS